MIHHYKMSRAAFTSLRAAAKAGQALPHPPLNPLAYTLARQSMAAMHPRFHPEVPNLRKRTQKIQRHGGS